MDLLIKSKLREPLLRSQLVARPRLVAQVEKGLRGPLTLIAAPAGFGKTTLAAAALAAGGCKAAWLSLDEADDEIGRFLTYLLAALQAAGPALRPALGEAASELLAGPQLADPTLVLATLVNDLMQHGQERDGVRGSVRDGPLVLVLDDYHLIHSPAVHAAVTFLLDHAPQALHIVIITRADPPLPLARLRARGHLVEVRAADLRFTLEESAAFLRAAAGVRLTDELVALLDQRTEGWAAGLQLAALRLAGEAGSGQGADPHTVEVFVRRFSGTQRYVLDYLIEEVLQRQVAAVQRFLLLTSLLGRLCGPLCDALLDAVGDEAGDEAGDRANDAPPSGAALLATLERANVFLMALDDERYWYRYHPLFADLLRARLREQYPGVEGRLHAAAAGWLEAHGCVAEAVAQALAAGDGEWAARLVEQHTVGLLAHGELASLLGMITALPPAVREKRPILCLQQAYALAFAGRLDGAGTALDLAEQAVAGGAQADAFLAGGLGAVRAMLAVMAGREEAAVGLAHEALALLPPETHWDRAAAYWALGYARRSLGDLEEAQACFREQIRLARVMGNVWTLVTGLADLALVLRTGGELQQAETLFVEALHEAGQQGARSLGYIARMETGLAAVLYERNDLAAALPLLDSAAVHLRQWPNPNHIAYTYLLLARVKRAQGELDAARVALDTAQQACQAGPVTRVLRRSVEVELVRVRFERSAEGAPLPGGVLAAEAERLAARWWEDLAGPAPAGVSAVRWDETTEMALFALARPPLAAPAGDVLLPLLERAATNAAAAQRVGAQIEALLLLALVRARSEERLAALEQALALGGPRGYVRVFVDAGPPLQALLGRWLAAVGAHPWRGYAARLLAAFDVHNAGQQAARSATAPSLPAPSLPAPSRPASVMTESLSGRELEVLVLLAQGLSNQQIAAHLVVAPGTVKAHTAAIYRKLDVGNRTEAAACARRLGLL